MEREDLSYHGVMARIFVAIEFIWHCFVVRWRGMNNDTLGYWINERHSNVLTLGALGTHIHGRKRMRLYTNNYDTAITACAKLSCGVGHWWRDLRPEVVVAIIV